MSLMVIALAFIVGFLLGGIVCYIVTTKITNKNSLVDELTKLKREAAIKHRIINEFFSNAENQFLVLDRAYKSYAKFMQNSSKQFIQTDTDDVFYEKQTNDYLDNKKKFIDEDDDEIEVKVKDLREDTNSTDKVKVETAKIVEKENVETKKEDDAKKDVSLEEEKIQDTAEKDTEKSLEKEKEAVEAEKTENKDEVEASEAKEEKKIVKPEV